MIPITRPFMPRLEEYESYIWGIWQRQWLTNNGPLVNELELQLKQYLYVPHMLYVSNGTSALQIAIRALGLKGEIITTPFSFIATRYRCHSGNCRQSQSQGYLRCFGTKYKRQSVFLHDIKILFL